MTTSFSDIFKSSFLENVTSVSVIDMLLCLALAFGAFSSTSASDAVNSPIDSPVSGGDVSDRPMVAWIFENETYLEAYHAVYAEFVENNLANGWLSAEIERVYQMIRPYAEKDPTAFYTAEELDQAVQTLQTFCEKRAESVQGQLGGTIQKSKPNADIFEYTLNKFGLNAEESIFIDDNSPNVEAAEKCGLHGFTYHGEIESLRAKIEALMK